MATRKVKSAGKPVSKRSKTQTLPVNGGVPPENGSPRPSHAPSEDQIRVRAYEIFLTRGGNHGDDWNDWFIAQRELSK